MKKKPPVTPLICAAIIVLLSLLSCGVEPSAPTVVGSDESSSHATESPDEKGMDPMSGSADATGQNGTDQTASAEDKDADADLSEGKDQDIDLDIAECKGKAIWGLRSETEFFTPLGANPLALQQTSSNSFSFYLDRFRQFSAAGQGPYHNATNYGVKILPVEVKPGAWYWRAIGVHHLLANENRSKHHLYVEALDAQGQQIRDPNLFAALYSSDTGVEANSMRLDKPLNEPAGNQPMYKGTRIFVGMQRAGDLQNFPSERVVGIHSEHDDEPLPDGEIYNSYGHHSFYVVFQLTQMPKRVLTVEGVGIAGEQVVLTSSSGNTIEAESVVAGRALFKNLEESSYFLTYEDHPEDRFPLPYTPNQKTKAVTLRLDASACP